MSDDTPTERFTPPPPAGEPAVDTATPNAKNRSRILITTLAVVGGVLLIVVIVLLTLLFARGTGGVGPESTNSATPTPEVTASETPSESPNEAPDTAPSTPPNPSSPPVATGPVFESFSPSNNSSAGCSNDTGSVPVTFTWSSSGATEAAIGVDTADAFASPYQTGLPPTGSFDLDYQCSLGSQTYTVSIRGITGQTNKTILLTR